MPASTASGRPASSLRACPVPGPPPDRTLGADAALALPGGSGARRSSRRASATAACRLRAMAPASAERRRRRRAARPGSRAGHQRQAGQADQGAYGRGDGRQCGGPRPGSGTGRGTSRHGELLSSSCWCRDGAAVNRPDGRARRADGGPANMALCPFGGGVIGNTTGSGPVVGGSSPPPRATPTRQSPRSAAWGFCLR